MKKFLFSMMCLLVLTGCEKNIEVVRTIGDYEIEKVATLPGKGDHDEGMWLSLYSCEEDTICVLKQYNDSDESITYQINLKDYSVKETKRDDFDDLFQNITQTSEKTDEGYLNQVVYQMSDKEKMIKIEETIFDETHATERRKISITYENEIESKLLVEMDNAFSYDEENMMLNNAFVVMKNDRSVIIEYNDKNDFIISHVEVGGKITELVREPLIRDGMNLTYCDFDYENNSVLSLFYKDDKKRRVYYNDQLVEVGINESPLRISEDYIIIQESDEKDVITNTAIYNLKTNERKECSEILDGHFDFDYKANDTWLFNPNDNLERDDDKYYSIVEITDDQIILKEIPFEKDQYTALPLDDGSYLFITSGIHNETIEIYHLH